MGHPDIPTNKAVGCYNISEINFTLTKILAWEMDIREWGGFHAEKNICGVTSCFSTLWVPGMAVARQTCAARAVTHWTFSPAPSIVYLKKHAICCDADTLREGGLVYLCVVARFLWQATISPRYRSMCIKYQTTDALLKIRYARSVSKSKSMQCITILFSLIENKNRKFIWSAIAIYSFNDKRNPSFNKTETGYAVTKILIWESQHYKNKQDWNWTSCYFETFFFRLILKGLRLNPKHLYSQAQLDMVL